jgi:predicted nucleic acid-binding protein
MRIIVSDTSCLIDLRKADLLSATMALPFTVQVALPVAHDELSDFGPDDWQRLTDLGLQIVDLDGERVALALELMRTYRRLSSYDALSLALAEQQRDEDCILLTSDRDLRRAGEALAIEVHGVLWVIDRIAEEQLLSARELHAALIRLRDDPLVFLPQQELEIRLQRFAGR